MPVQKKAGNLLNTPRVNPFRLFNSGRAELHGEREREKEREIVREREREILHALVLHDDDDDDDNSPQDLNLS